jgi:glycosyltransferase involved in cell wall biosynthesis
MLFPYAPLPPPRDLGGTKRNLPFLRENLKRHDVSILSYGTGNERELLANDLGGAVKRIEFVNKARPRILNGLEQLWLLTTGRSTFRQIFRIKMQKKIDEILELERFDVIHCCTQMFGFFRFPANIPVVSDTHEITFDLFRRMFKVSRNLVVKILSYFKYKLGKKDELRICAGFDALIATTSRDRQEFQRALPHQQIFVVENGVDRAFFQFPVVEEVPGLIVFTGKMDYYPNLHGIMKFIDQILPLVTEREPRARLLVVGANPPKSLLRRASKKVQITGFVEDVRPFVAKAQAFIIPLWIGGGIRGKALEAMAMKKPLVTTSIGCEGIKVKNGETALFADSNESFAGSVLTLFSNPLLRQRLSNNAFQLVQKEYDWSQKGDELTRVYESVLHKRNSTRSLETFAEEFNGSLVAAE